MAHVSLSADHTEPFYIPALGQHIPADGDKPAQYIPNQKIEIRFRVPTFEDRDMIAIRMYVMGVRDVTADQVRALILSEIYAVYPEDKADDIARFMDGCWTREQQYQADLNAWQEQESIRRLDSLEAGEEFEGSPPPEQAVSIKERAEMNIITANVTDGSQRLRQKLADQQLYQVRYRYAVLQLTLAAWSGLKTEAAFVPGGVMDAPMLTKGTIESIRAELMEMDPTGAAYLELAEAAERMYDLPVSAEKNSSSPLVNFSPPDGSTTANTESANKGGGSNTRKSRAKKPA